MKTVVGRIQCYYESCSYQVPMIASDDSYYVSNGEKVYVAVDLLAAKIHHRYAHGEEIEL
jgi:hypothetical protein